MSWRETLGVTSSTKQSLLWRVWASQPPGGHPAFPKEKEYQVVADSICEAIERAEVAMLRLGGPHQDDVRYVAFKAECEGAVYLKSNQGVE